MNIAVRFSIAWFFLDKLLNLAMLSAAVILHRPIVRSSVEAVSILVKETGRSRVPADLISRGALPPGLSLLVLTKAPSLT